MVRVCLPHHVDDADARLVLVAVPLHRLEVSLSSTAETDSSSWPQTPELVLLFPLQPEEDLGLRLGPVPQGEGRVRRTQGGAQAAGTHELRRDQRPGTLRPHGGAVVHKGPSLHGRLGHPRLQRQSRVSSCGVQPSEDGLYWRSS